MSDPVESSEDLDLVARAAAFEVQLAASDELTVATSRALRTLDALLCRRGWGQPPQLWSAVVTGASTGRPLQVRWERHADSSHLRRMAVADALTWLAERSSIRRARTAVVGLAVTSEAWALRPETDPDLAAALTAADGRSIHTDPGRIETRIVTCVDVAGLTYSHLTSRDPDALGRVESVNRLEGPQGGTSVRGDVPRALARLVQASTSVT